MSVITVSRGSFCKGGELAEKLAEKLGYECLANEILCEASDSFNIPEIKLSCALHDAPPLLNRYTCLRQKYLSFISYSLLNHLQKDNIVYHGLAGPLFLKRVPHILKVKIVSNIEDRIIELLKRLDVSEQKARQLLEKSDENERKWSQRQFGTDISDTKHYDLVLHVNKMSEDDAVNIIAEASKRTCFQKTTESREIYNDLLNAAKIQSVLIEKFPKIGVTSKRGRVYINNKGVFGQGEYMKKQILAFLHDIPDYKDIDVDVSSVLDL